MIQMRAEKSKVAVKKKHFLEMYAGLRPLHLSETTAISGFANTHAPRLRLVSFSPS